MTLSALLLGSATRKKEKSLDTGLDDLFKSTQTEGAKDASATDAVAIKKKRGLKTDGQPSQPKPKKQKRAFSPPRRQPSPDEEGSEPDAPSDSSALLSLKQGGSGNDESEKVVSDKDGTEVDRDHDTEDSGDSDTDSSDAENEDEDGSVPVHETLQKTKHIAAPSGSRMQKFVPQGETTEQRNARTIFIGNLPKDVAQKRPLQKQLHRHILSFVPTAKIESSRFRSIAFQVPTSKLPDDSAKPTPTKGRQHDRDRAASWRAFSGKSEDVAKADEKKFLTPAQKKKIAFISQQFHPTADSVNAYIVFAHPRPASSRPSNLPPLSPSLDPYEAARIAVEKCHSTVFMERVIRVDTVVPLSSDASVDKSHATGASDPRLTIFVGNLDFESKEDDLRVFFEGLVSTERGPPPPTSETGADSSKGHWVDRVRIVRDGQTRLGKGFAYVHFVDRVCVDEILAMDVSRLKFAKRKLRVQRCKTAAAALPLVVTSGKKPIEGVKSSRPMTSPKVSLPKGDPSLGSKLAHLSKEERKKVKAEDSDRRARRLAKKKARNALSTKDSGHVKDRERARKQSTMKKLAPTHPQKKGRVRSEKSLAKRNFKK